MCYNRSDHSKCLNAQLAPHHVWQVHIEGTISGIAGDELGPDMKKNGAIIKTGKLVTDNLEFYQGKPQVGFGTVVEDEAGQTFFLRDDFVFRKAKSMPSAPERVPTLKDSYINGTTLYAKIYNDTYDGRKDGDRVEITTYWRQPSDNTMKNRMGGQLIQSADRRTYYIERYQALLRPHLSSADYMSIRERLPAVGEGKTILDVLTSEAEKYTNEMFGPCLSMPRLFYGFHENRTDSSWIDMAPEGFADDDFVTLRYRWHAKKDAVAGNLFQKTIVDVSRLKMDDFKGQAHNIHTPWRRHCRNRSPRYSASFLRVVSFLFVRVIFLCQTQILILPPWYTSCIIPF